jgi:hypothetical protein
MHYYTTVLPSVQRRVATLTSYIPLSPANSGAGQFDYPMLFTQQLGIGGEYELSRNFYQFRVAIAGADDSCCIVYRPRQSNDNPMLIVNWYLIPKTITFGEFRSI